MSYEEAAEIAARYAQTIMNMQPVYDAAMAWYAACRDQEDYDVDQTDEELDKLWEVCRRAKEGK